MTEPNPLNDDDYDGNDEQIDDLKDVIHGLMCDVEYLLLRAHKHLVDPTRIAKIKARIKSLNEET